jgi:hypothetical protein
MTAVAVEFKTSEQLKVEREELLRSVGATMEELTAQAELSGLGVREFGVYEAVSDIDYLLGV